jgi:hypothetical protein
MSNEPRPNENEPRISEADVKRILERAIQLDTVRTTEVTLAELRRVADEVGISPVALMQAFEENQLGKTSGPPLARPIEPSSTGWLNRARRLLRPVWLASAASMLGLFTAWSGVEELMLSTFFLTIVGSVILAIMHRLRRSDAVLSAEAGIATAEQLHDARHQGWRFQLDLLAIWVPWSILNGLAEEEILLVGSLAWSIAAVVGMGIVLLLNPKPKLPTADIRSGAPRGPEAAVS